MRRAGTGHGSTAKGRPAALFRLVACCCWGYLGVVLCFWLVVVLAGDRHWLATLLLFGPRWLLGLPLLVLVPLALVLCRRLILPLAAAALVVAVPLLGLQVPLGHPSPATGPVLRVLTCNIDVARCDREALAALIRDSSADLVALQESPREMRDGLPAGWHRLQQGELTIYSRYPLRSLGHLEALHPPHRWPRASLLDCRVTLPGGELSFATVHLPSPRYGLSSVLDRRTLLSPARSALLERELAHRREVADQVQRALEVLPKPLLVAGDFNTPPDSTLYRRYWSTYANAFSERGTGYGWSMRAKVRRIGFGLRIDHILCGSGLAVRSCALGPSIGSDHLPLIADLEILP